MANPCCRTPASSRAPARAIEVRARCNQGRVRVSVRDYGKGIPPEFQPRVFQKFSQADSSDSRSRAGIGPRARHQSRHRRAARRPHRFRDRVRRHARSISSCPMPTASPRGPWLSSNPKSMSSPIPQRLPFRNSDILATVLVALGVVIARRLAAGPAADHPGRPGQRRHDDAMPPFVSSSLDSALGFGASRATMGLAAVLLAIPSVLHVVRALVQDRSAASIGCSADSWILQAAPHQGRMAPQVADRVRARGIGARTADSPTKTAACTGSLPAGHRRDLSDRAGLVLRPAARARYHL